MKIQICSDIHTDHFRDNGTALINELRNASDAEVLVIAGDISVFPKTFDFLNKISKFYDHIVCVLGNHDYYFGDAIKIENMLKSPGIVPDNVHILNNNIIKIKDQRFIGNTLWYPFDKNIDFFKYNMTDYHVISNFDTWVLNKNLDCQKFLIKNIKDGDIVITHHLPSYICIDPMYDKSNLNIFYVCEMISKIKKNITWIHGHAHTAYEKTVGNLKLIANPLGYIMSGEETGFDPAKTIIV